MDTSLVCFLLYSPCSLTNILNIWFIGTFHEPLLFTRVKVTKVTKKEFYLLLWSLHLWTDILDIWCVGTLPLPVPLGGA